MKHTAIHVVRTYECDSYGHVNNAVYLNYLEYARKEFLTAVGFNYKGVIDAGYFIPITHIDIHYKASAFIDDKLFIEVVPVKLKRVYGVFQQKVYKEDGTVCAEAEVTWACVTKNFIPHPIPDEFMVPGMYPEGDPRAGATQQAPPC